MIPVADAFAFGHECVAEVLDVGDAVRTVRPGDRVVVPFQISCGTCVACSAGRTANCRTVPRGSAYGMQPLGGDWGGALADVLRVPFADAMLVPLPGGAEPAALASVADNVADGYRAVAGPLRATPGEEVLIVGGWARSVGLYATACALALGASRVVFADSDAGRLERAAALGAETIDASAGWPAKLGRFAITVDASGDHAGLHAALRSTAPDGVCTSVAIYFEPATPLPLLEMYTRGCSLHTGRVHARAVIPEVLALITAGKLDPRARDERGRRASTTLPRRSRTRRRSSCSSLSHLTRRRASASRGRARGRRDARPGRVARDAAAPPHHPARPRSWR